MRAVVQRVRRARVTVAGETVGEIGLGLLVLLGVAIDDGSADVVWMSNKLVGLRIFEDAGGKMNLPLSEVAGAMLVVSQFTLLGDCRKGRRPSFDRAARPDQARGLYESFTASVRSQGIPVATGVFQAEMQVELVNDGPITLIVDSRESVAGTADLERNVDTERSCGFQPTRPVPIILERSNTDPKE